MAKNQKTLTDPVEEKTPEEERLEIEEEKGLVSVDSLDISEWKAAPASASAMPRPFDGYPMEDIIIKTMDKRGKEVEVVVKKTFLVALNPQLLIPQDPSGVNVTIEDKKTKKEKVVTIASSHSRVIVDYENGKNNTAVVFDRVLTDPKGRDLYYAVVPSHSVRAQLIYEWDDKAERLKKPNGNYVLLDDNQLSRLKQVFMIYKGKEIKKMAREIRLVESDNEKG